MRTHSRRCSAAAAAALASALGASCAVAADAMHPAVVELFQSQGCSSCPPANANVLSLADRPDLLVLSWQVTYWDNLGWKDTFGKPEFTARQWDYAHALHRWEVGTPQVVVNGRADVVGSRRDELVALITKADRGDGGPEIRLEPRRVTISGLRGAGVVVLVRYDPNTIEVPIRRGENGGRTLPHRNVVREVAGLGEWTGGARAFVLPAASRPGLKTAVLVQDGRGGPILAAAHD
jgi:hypothetical protein